MIPIIITTFITIITITIMIQRTTRGIMHGARHLGTFQYLIFGNVIIIIIIMITIIMGCTQIPIITLSHIWVFVRLYGIMFVIIVIAIIITIIIKSEGVNAQL